MAKNLDIKRDNNGGYLIREKPSISYTSDRLWLVESIKELKTGQKENHERTTADITKIKENLAALNVRAGMWGVLGGAVVFAAACLQSKFLR